MSAHVISADAEESFVVTTSDEPGVDVVVPEGGTLLTVSTGAVGPKGDPGAPGAPGAPGEPGPPGGSYRHVQSVAAAVWTVEHNLGFQPNVTVVDSAGQRVIGRLEYLTTNIVRITFSAAFSGEAYLS